MTEDKKTWFEKHAVITVLVFLFVIIFLSLAGFEKYLASRNSSNVTVNNKGVKRYIRLREHPPLMVNTETDKLSGSEQIIRFGIDENGFIQPSKIYNNPDMNIFFIGGSTTECIAVMEEHRFPYLAGRLLEKKLNKKINSYNSGVAGNNSMHSIDILLNKVFPLKPTIVVMMHNINDIAILWHYGTYWNSSLGRSLIVSPVQPSCYNTIKKSVNSMIPNAYAKIDSAFNKIMKKLSPDMFDEFSDVRSFNKTINKKDATELFRQNLQTFVSICQIRGILPVLMTQENRFKSDPDESINKPFTGINYSDLKEASDEFNDIIRQVGQTAGVLVIDLDKEIPKDEWYIVDQVHFSDAGSKLAAEIIARELGNYLVHLQKL